MSINFHTFYIGDKILLYDVGSGSLHEISETCNALLEGLAKNNDNTDNFLDSLRSQAKKKWSKDDDVTEAFEQLSNLHEQGLLCFYKKSDHVKFNTEKDSKKPLGVKALCLHPAHACNMDCKYCFADGGLFNGQTSYMDTKTAERAVDFLIDQSGARKNLEIDFFGGEPLLNFSVIKETVEYARKQAEKYNKSFKFTLTTNGLALTDEIIDYIINENFAVVMSIDGRKHINDYYRTDLKGNGTYDKILPKFQKLAHALTTYGSQEYYMRGTYTKQNLDFSKDVLHLAELGFKHISVEPVIGDLDSKYSLSSNDLDYITKEYKLIADESSMRSDLNFFHFNIDLEGGPCSIKKITGCGAGFDYLAVDPSGDIFPCHQFVSKNEFYMGNVSKPEQINKDISKRLKSCNILTKDICKTCWARYLCGGGCHANAFNINENLDTPYDVDCAIKKIQFEHALYLKALNN
ncbi:thioether cross-link-forming SCIFF peptide maturase [Natranaerobius trueperi]|nr:thioether cross-link-forming SCIFF peptide maturase [Natranaerobius trueperi]